MRENALWRGNARRPNVFGNALGNYVVGEMGPKAAAPVMQQQTETDDPFDIGANFKRGLGEKIDQYYEDHYQQRLQAEIDAGVAGDGSAVQYGAQAPAPYEEMPAYKPNQRAARKAAELGEFAGRSRGSMNPYSGEPDFLTLSGALMDEAAARARKNGPQMVATTDRNIAKNYAEKNSDVSLASLISASAATSDALENGIPSFAKGAANNVLGRSGSLWLDRMVKIEAASSLVEARSLIKSSSAKSAIILDQASKAVDSLSPLGKTLGTLDLGLKLLEDPSARTVAAWGVSNAGAAGMVFATARAGAVFGGLFPPPMNLITIPVGAGIGVAGGYLTYEFGGVGDVVYNKSRAWLDK